MGTAQLTDDDVGKDVVAGDGREVGTVSTVEDGTAYVDPNPGRLTDVTALGWEDIDDEDGYPLLEDAVESVTDDEVRLGSN